MTDLRSVYEGKRIVVTGATGMIGMHLIPRLIDLGAAEIIAIGMSPPIQTTVGYDELSPGVRFYKRDLCLPCVLDPHLESADFVFHLAGIKGSVAVGRSNGHAFFTNTVLMNTLVIESAYRYKTPLLYTSSIAVYPPGHRRSKEEGAFKGPPDFADWYGAYAKRAGEVQLDAMAQGGWNDWVIVRPSNVFGPYDNFDAKTGMVVSALIRRAHDGENPLGVWGHGKAIRDFIYADDVARGMVFAMARGRGNIYNLGSGGGTSVRTLVGWMSSYIPEFPEVKWLGGIRTQGQSYKVLDSTKAYKDLAWRALVFIGDALWRTALWYDANPGHQEQRYDPFKETPGE